MRMYVCNFNYLHVDYMRMELKFELSPIIHSAIQHIV